MLDETAPNTSDTCCRAELGPDAEPARRASSDEGVPPTGAEPEVVAVRYLPRRTVLAAAGTVGAVGLLAACGGDDGAGDEPTPDPTANPTGDISANAIVLAKTADVPVNGALFVPERELVISQPEAGQFFAYGARCPHQGCMVSDYESDQMVCPCHGSRFDPATGDVLQGPAATGLEPVEILVDGDQILAPV